MHWTESFCDFPSIFIKSLNVVLKSERVWTCHKSCSLNSGASYHITARRNLGREQTFSTSQILCVVWLFLLTGTLRWGLVSRRGHMDDLFDLYLTSDLAVCRVSSYSSEVTKSQRNRRRRRRLQIFFKNLHLKLGKSM